MDMALLTRRALFADAVEKFRVAAVATSLGGVLVANGCTTNSQVGGTPIIGGSKRTIRVVHPNATVSQHTITEYVSDFRVLDATILACPSMGVTCKHVGQGGNGYITQFGDVMEDDEHGWVYSVTGEEGEGSSVPLYTAAGDYWLSAAREVEWRWMLRNRDLE